MVLIELLSIILVGRSGGGISIGSGGSSCSSSSSSTDISGSSSNSRDIRNGG